MKDMTEENKKKLISALETADKASEKAGSTTDPTKELYCDLEGFESEFSGSFVVAYPDASFKNGDELPAPKTHACPPSKFSYVPAPGHMDTSKKYTLIMCDPDAPDRKGHAFREFVHYVVSDVTQESLAAGGALEGKTVVEYLGVGCPCKSGFHRYVFLLFQQPEGSTPASLAEAFEGRGGKKVCVAAKAAGLGKVVAATWFQSTWDVSIDAVHVAMGWLPPAPFRSPTQEAANPEAAAA